MIFALTELAQLGLGHLLHALSMLCRSQTIHRWAHRWIVCPEPYVDHVGIKRLRTAFEPWLAGVELRRGLANPHLGDEDNEVELIGEWE